MNVAGRFNTLTAAVLPPPADEKRREHVVTLFTEYEREVFERTNRFFSWLLISQWAFAIAFAAIWSPLTWEGRESAIHPHLWGAIVIGTMLAAAPLWLIRTMPYDLITRQVVAAAQMGFSALLIDVTGGRIETHFHVFGSLAFLALYRDWRVFPTATLVVALDHLLRGIYFPESVYGVPYATIWRTAEHAGWVIFEDVVLVWASFVSRREMWEICLRQDQNEQLLGDLEERVRDRTRDLQAEVRERERTAQDLRRSEERYRQLIANVPIGIVETTRQGEVRLVNPHLWAMLGLEGQFEAGRLHLGDGKIFPLADRERFWVSLSEKKEVRGFETTIYRPDGSAIPVMLNARLSRAEGNEAVCEGTVEDMTERRKAATALEKAHQQLVSASRQAGQADVATGVLHNVGNVLTSVNLIVHDVQDRLKTSRVSHLHRVVEMLRREEHRLAEFFASDPAGKALPGFLGKLDTRLNEETNQLSSDFQILVRHFDHIREIIQAQQSSAKLFGVIESLAADQLIEDALRLKGESFVRHRIVVVRRFGSAPRVRADRHKVLQILVNLLSNAKDALLAEERAERRVLLRIAALDAAVAIEVKDNGMGISPDNMRKIFQHGFTTKRDGHGFGLHSCVLAAREMGGDLVVASDGEGQGASFTLRLPIEAPAAAAA